MSESTLQGLVKTGLTTVAVLIVIAYGAYYYASRSQAEVPVASVDAGTKTKSVAAGANSSHPNAAQSDKPQSGKPESGKPQAGAKAGGKPASGKPTGGRRGRGPSLVVATKVTEGTINDRLTAVGDVEAIASVDVFPLDGGLLKEVLVGSGQDVKAGDALALLDSEAEEIARNRAKSAVDEARVKVIRIQKLFKSRTSTQAELDEAQSVLNSARLALEDAELSLRRRIINAPINGKVGIVAVTVGSFINTQSSIVTIDDRSSLYLDFWVPERFANAVKIGQPLDATSYAFPGKAFQGNVSAVGSRVERDSRTFLIRATIANESDLLRPGMSFSVELQFPGDTYAQVDPLAVQWDSQGSFVWKLVEDKVTRAGIRIVQRNTDRVLVDGEIAAGDRVVSEGVLSLREGASVTVAGEEKSNRKSGERR